jgi:hypothetical protein
MSFATRSYAHEFVCARSSKETHPPIHTQVGAASPRHAREMHAWVMECISALLDQMTSLRLRLYRRKVDHIVIVAYLLRYCAVQSVRHAVVPFFCHVFRMFASCYLVM